MLAGPGPVFYFKFNDESPEDHIGYDAMIALLGIS